MCWVDAAIILRSGTMAIKELNGHCGIDDQKVFGGFTGNVLEGSGIPKANDVQHKLYLNQSGIF